jgi:hypothetical protein
MNEIAAQRIFRAKTIRRRQLAQLPVVKKIRIVVQLQQIAADIRKGGRHKVWRIG